MSFSNWQPILQSFLQADGLPFADVLPEDTIRQIALEAGASPEADQACSVYTTAMTLWAFLSQVLFRGEQRSCTAAVARVIVLCVALGREPCSDDTGAYCRARARLPLALIQNLTYHIADQAEANSPQAWLWKGRHVDLIDGTTVSAPDTPSLQAKFPQMKSQKPGLGFPIIRMVVLLSLATAMVRGMAMGPYAGKETGETALFRQLFDRLKPGHIVLADRYFCSYFMIALLLAGGVDIVTRLHQHRSCDFRRGRRLGHGDHIVTWQRPQRPKWMDKETYAQMPESIEVREIYVKISQPGFRVDNLIVVTSLTDSNTYSRDDIAELYHKRWLVELDIRAIKSSIGMDQLRCKSPEMVTKEIWTCLLAYNLIRQSMMQAAQRANSDTDKNANKNASKNINSNTQTSRAENLSPRQLSFTAAMQKLAASWSVVHLLDEKRARMLIDAYLHDLAQERVGDRPGRVEPRAVKRRPKPHPLLSKPRKQARAELLGGSVA